MRLEDEDECQPIFVQEQKLAALEKQLYGHVRAAIDLDAISQLEQHLALVLCDDFQMSTDLALDVSMQIIEAAIRRVADDPARVVSFGAPDGISEEEKAAVAFDAKCPFCCSARESRERANARGDHEAAEESCACCEILRAEWREKHAEVLAQAGLRPVSSEAALAGAIEIAKRDLRRREKPS